MKLGTFSTFSNFRIRKCGKRGFEWSKDYAESKGLASHRKIAPTIKRLEWLYNQDFSTHGFEALFLIGSMSWGRFHAVNDEPNNVSDLDILILVDTFRSTKTLSQLKAINVQASHVFVGIMAEKSIIDAHFDVVAFESKLEEQDFSLSCTLMRKDTFLSMLRGDMDKIIAIRNKPISVDNEIRRYNYSSELCRPVVTNVSSSKIQRVVSTLFLPKVGFGLPAYLELILPNMEYFGYLSPDVENAIQRFGWKFGRKLSQMPSLIPFSHYRYSRMSINTRQRIADLMMHGPCSLG